VGELDELPPPEDLRIASSENESRLGPVPGTVKWWKPEKGYGVVLTPETAPKEIWVSFMHIEGEGFRELVQGEAVDIEYEPAMQDSFRFRAIRVRRRP
jgi:CspA family cold shock protein